MLKTAKNVVFAAAHLESQQFQKYDAIRANPFQFISAFFALFDGLCQLPSAFLELERQDWRNITCNCRKIFKISGQFLTFTTSTLDNPGYTLSTESTTMTSPHVDLLLTPFNDGRNTLPVLKVDHQIFVFDEKGFHVFPVVRIYFHFTLLVNV